ncbi:sugar MFS transporter [Rhodoferax sp. PAMC 29310]|uniref:MFS transporter n=1 Tax=Rhodoferax sp. PAMC 29310 TaxID=2822760 RepID=UPI001B319CDA|nr:MFS transporter [Rhodoferax sp. PAMC 29310]
MAHFLLLVVIYIAFVSLGLPDGVLGVAWPAMRADFGQPLAAVGLITIVMTVCGAFSAIFSGRVIARWGTGVVVMLSGLLTGLALLGFSWAPSFWWLLALATLLGLGAGAVDTGLNHFVAKHYSSRHMNWLHGFWGLGATMGPFVMGSALASNVGWTGGYRTIGLVQLSLAALLCVALPLWKRESPGESSDDTEQSSALAGFKPINPWALWLAPLTFLLYVAAEVGTALWAASILITSRQLDALTAGVWVSLFFASITAGRFGIGVVANRLGNRHLVRVGLCTAVAGATLFAIPVLPPPVSLFGLMLMGLGCAPVYPSLMHETARRFPPLTARRVIGRQLMFSYVGGSFMPAAFGVLATYAGLVWVMPVVVVLLLLLLAVTRPLDQQT